MMWFKRYLNHLTKKSIKLNAVQWSIEETKNEKKLEEIINDFEGKENLCRCEVGLRNIVK